MMENTSAPIVSLKGTVLNGLDLETTGVDIHTAIPVSVAWITSVNDEEIIADYHLCDPGIEIPEAASNIHRLRTKDVKGAATSEFVICKIANRLISTAIYDLGPVIGMNIRYDLSIVHRYRRLNSHLNVIDVLVIDRHFDKYRSGKRNLGALCHHYGVPVWSLHNALADVRACMAIFKKQQELYLELEGLTYAELTAAQMLWHHQWCNQYDMYRAMNGMERLSDETWEWPWVG